MSEGQSKSNGHKRLSVDELADRARFRFREEELEIPEVGGSIVLKSLSVREREMLPDPTELLEVDDVGERTKRAIKNAAQVFSVIVAEPEVTPEQAEEFLGDWPADAFDRVTSAYGDLVGGKEDEKAAASAFPQK
jgi:DnaJ-domain-containing protein 1